MADLTNRNADETVPDIATWGTGNVLETGEGTVKVDLDDKASLSGNVAQVRQVIKTDTYSESVASRPTTSSDIPGLLVSISPKRIDSKIVVMAHMVVSGDPRIGLQIYRDGVQIALPDSFGSRQGAVTNTQLPARDRTGPLSGVVEEFPNTTDEITYTVRLAHLAGDGATLFVNRGEDDQNSDSRYRGISTLTVMEFAQ